jgi:hypothetical protein
MIMSSSNPGSNCFLNPQGRTVLRNGLGVMN